MSNWIAAEFAKFKAWAASHAESTDSKLAALEKRVATLEGAKNAPTSPAAS